MAGFNFWFFVAALALAGSQVTRAYTDEENFDYINKVINVLNVYWECQLPTYAEVDELQKSFSELEFKYGDLLETKLNADHKLVRKTLLDQWESFQRHMTGAVVIRSAKKRSFLGKVELYQKAKFGFSICTQIRDLPGPITDRIFEKNPIVRYVKHLDNGLVPEPNAEQEQDDLEKPAEVIHTPISETEQKPKQAEISESSPLDESSLPIPPVNNEEEEKAKEVETEEENKNQDTYDPLADIPVPAAQEDPSAEALNVIDSTPKSTESQGAENPTDKESLDVVTEATVTEEPVTPLSMVKLFEIGAEYVDDDVDDEDLNRLDKVAPVEWNIDPVYGNFKWPDENQSQEEPFIDNGIKTDWNNFLADPDAVVEEEERHKVAEQVTEEPVTEEPEYVSRRLSPKELRRRRKELLNKISGDRRSREQDSIHGFSHTPERGDESEEQEHPSKKDRWVNLADNNLCKISYNKDYIGKTRPVKAVKSFIGSKKRAMMSRA